VPVRVLIVDDHASFRWLARLLLVVAGCDVIGEAADAGGARELVERLHPDAVLLDVMLPDGFRGGGGARAQAVGERFSRNLRTLLGWVVCLS
jgi:DNA-binding NarL/FixJ family response regulator